MLTHLQIKNFTIIDQLAIDLKPNMTVLTGETGAGKSILIDTLELVLGARADNKIIRHGCERCEIVAIFAISNKPEVKQWLKHQDLNNDAECIIRRTINLDGHSRSSINGSICTQQLTRELGSLLVNIHGQHEHQSLLKRDKQLSLLDTFAGHQDLCAQVKQAYLGWQQINHELQALQQLTDDSDSQTELLNYQIKELDELALAENELETLHLEHKQLVNAEQLLQNCNTALDLLTETNLASAQKQLTSICDIDPKINTANELINNAIIQAEEASITLRDYLNHLDLNPERLQQVEQRLNLIHDLARKHHINPEELFALHQQLTTKLQQITNAAEKLENIQQQLQQATNAYKKVAQQLTTSRTQAAAKLSQAIRQQMQQLNMPNGKFDIKFATPKAEKFTATGLEQIEFLVTTNPGQPLQSLTKVASGGELSRISLAIQVITAQQDTTPTLIFDEVDVGIGGKTAAIVGNLLKILGNTAQVICVTHLPQVAAQGHNHLQVSKQTTTTTTNVTVTTLTAKNRIEEIARMLGGIKITESTLAHAQEMLS